jgi:hypothetical protein
MLFDNIKKQEGIDEKNEKISKSNIINYYKKEFEGKSPEKRTF